MLCLQNVSKYYHNGNGEKIAAVDRLNFRVNPHDFICIVGRSGCGKTTTLRMIAGLEKATEGVITLNGQKINGPSPKRCVVFQKYTLFPWRTIIGNIAFGLEMQQVKKKERLRIAERYLDLVGLGAYAHAYPHELSGGMQQRVAVARALAVVPEVLLMDEPFGALDAQTRSSLQSELIKIWQKNRKTIIFVTHSINEAVLLADRVVIMKSNPGRIHRILENKLPRPRDIHDPDVRGLTREIHAELEAV